MEAIVMNGVGEADQLECIERPDPIPGAGEVLIDVAAAGVNFMDIGVRRRTVWAEMPNPKVLGVEGSGRIAALGEGVTDLPQFVGTGARMRKVKAQWVPLAGCTSRSIVRQICLTPPTPSQTS
jgi:NADPH:quinone reductase-like Zn-dependent oxidoreductase